MANEYSHRHAVVGEQTDCCRKLRVIHISDTHMEHDDIIHSIPEGDVIVHSGDFSKMRFKNFFFKDHSNSEMLRKVNSFFEQLPHRFKIFVAGNHDTFLTRFSKEEITESLPAVRYLQDSFTVCDGVKFYGSPWTISSSKIKTSKAFTAAEEVLRERWGAVDSDTDVLITHTPPYGTLDYSRHLGDTPPKTMCQFCDKVHPDRGHAGCYSLREAVLQTIRPKMHLFGHLHGSAGLTEQDDIIFSNAAFASARRFNDSFTVCDGVKFYGSPWTISSSKIKTSKAFTAAEEVLRERWGAVDSDTDVLITHTPPYGTLDYSRHLGDTPPKTMCKFCGKVHPDRGHAGCYSLREAVLQTIRPKMPLFGHLHGSAGLTEQDGIIFSNAAFASARRFNVIDLFYK